jgi:hypothetical protein
MERAGDNTSGKYSENAYRGDSGDIEARFMAKKNSLVVVLEDTEDKQ